MPNHPSVIATRAPRRRLHSVEAAAEILGIGRSTTYEEIRLGRLRTVRRGRRRLVPAEYIDDYVELLKAETSVAESRA
ncbi:helix-turn-helix domain-containing protein [Streptosporangium nondiastaticum]|uniref:helix-turn-helix domain-containing protein n=1 Tax=Streptosporangium nondiastaticum TaxID=35764 RepID=UPI001CB9567D|nr:excisionase family DNA-binding protein [Streptosporangium nondiastaticum]